MTTHPSPHSSAQRLQLPRMHRILEVLWQHGGLAVHSFRSGRSGVLAAFSISHTLLCEHPSCAPLIAHVQPCAHPNCAGTIATLNHSWHTRCRVRFETRLLSAVKFTQHVRTRCGSSLSPLIDIVQPSPAAGRGWHVLHTTTTCGAISAHDDGTAPAAHASPHPRAPAQGHATHTRHVGGRGRGPMYI